jgi:hypothetical protein
LEEYGGIVYIGNNTQIMISSPYMITDAKEIAEAKHSGIS